MDASVLVAPASIKAQIWWASAQVNRVGRPRLRRFGWSLDLGSMDDLPFLMAQKNPPLMWKIQSIAANKTS